jgi:hypothetical protein
MLSEGKKCPKSVGDMESGSLFGYKGFLVFFVSNELKGPLSIGKKSTKP